ncbi:MAG: acyl-ACP desaturase [Acidobacteriota bacterium]|nr:acyl-ACP desaturase [Acidobacteriota bacterium]
MRPDFDRYISVSAKIETKDLDWEAAKQAGLTDDERFVLTYFSDIESQTIRYLRMLLQMKIAFKPDVSAFLTTWNYEEFFHGYELANLLAVCGYKLEENRVENVKGRARLNEWLEMLFAPLLSKIFYHQFPAVYLSFGAIQEMTTLRGYERLHSITQNPVLKTLCERIARQERRHFAWYFNHARELLQQSRAAQRLARRLLEFNWVPVGAGVKTPTEVYRLFSIIFPGEFGRQLVREVDAKMASLPGLEGIRLMEPYFERGGVL